MLLLLLQSSSRSHKLCAEVEAWIQLMLVPDACFCSGTEMTFFSGETASAVRCKLQSVIHVHVHAIPVCDIEQVEEVLNQK